MLKSIRTSEINRVVRMFLHLDISIKSGSHPHPASYSSCHRTGSNPSSANPLDRQTWDPSPWIECPSTDKMFRLTGQDPPFFPASENHSNVPIALRMFTITLQPKSVASHLRFSQFSKDARCSLLAQGYQDDASGDPGEVGTKFIRCLGSSCDAKTDAGRRT